MSKTDYLRQRGLSETLAKQFGLGYDPVFSQSTGGSVWKALIIPTGDGSFLARNTDPHADQKNRIRKYGASPLFNADALWQTEQSIFVVEGEFDALSVAEVGGKAVALGSVVNYRRFLTLMENRRPGCCLLIALDKDASGLQTSEKICERLEELCISYYRVDLCGGCKDPNEALIADRDTFAQAVSAAKNSEKEAAKVAKQAYLQNSVSCHLQSFIAGIADSVNTPYLPTGFDQLDACFDGGLFEGLYLLGGISSLGKTSFVIQIADQLAMQGQDVLFFSLEMARSEIMAKSISRLSLLGCLKNSIAVSNAKTARGITTGARWSDYTSLEKEVIQSAIQQYGTFTDSLYISEGVVDIGAGEIRRTVQTHLDCTGSRPVVFVDYIQILAPPERACHR